MHKKKIRKFRFFEDSSYTTIDFLNPSIEKYILANKRPKDDQSYVVMNNITASNAKLRSKNFLVINEIYIFLFNKERKKSHI